MCVCVCLCDSVMTLLFSKGKTNFFFVNSLKVRWPLPAVLFLSFPCERSKRKENTRRQMFNANFDLMQLQVCKHSMRDMLWMICYEWVKIIENYLLYNLDQMMNGPVPVHFRLHAWVSICIKNSIVSFLSSQKITIEMISIALQITRAKHLSAVTTIRAIQWKPNHTQLCIIDYMVKWRLRTLRPPPIQQWPNRKRTQNTNDWLRIQCKCVMWIWWKTVWCRGESFGHFNFNLQISIKNVFLLQWITIR